jgi:hypothetical protein
VLLHENLPHRLRDALSGHEVFTVRYQGWSGLKNGELFTAAEKGGFAVVVTGDQTMPYEQDLANRKIAVLVLSAIEWHIIRGSLAVIQSSLETAAPGSHRIVEVGVFERKKTRP